jgi:hypothetical protein
MKYASGLFFFIIFHLIFLETSIAKSYPNDKNLTIINKSSFTTKRLEDWSNHASSKMNPCESDVFVFICDVGEKIEPIQEFGPGVLHRVLMSPKEISENLKLLKIGLKILAADISIMNY